MNVVCECDKAVHVIDTPRDGYAFCQREPGADDE
jgi:hypothetical protein